MLHQLFTGRNSPVAGRRRPNDLGAREFATAEMSHLSVCGKKDEVSFAVDSEVAGTVVGTADDRRVPGILCGSDATQSAASGTGENRVKHSLHGCSQGVCFREENDVAGSHRTKTLLLHVMEGRRFRAPLPVHGSGGSTPAPISKPPIPLPSPSTHAHRCLTWSSSVRHSTPTSPVVHPRGNSRNGTAIPNWAFAPPPFSSPPPGKPGARSARLSAVYSLNMRPVLRAFELAAKSGLCRLRESSGVGRPCRSPLVGNPRR